MIWCVVPAAGLGQRFGGVVPKQYAPLVGQPMLVRTLDRLASHPDIAGLMVALSENDKLWPGISELEGKPVLTCVGGITRAQSVWNGLQALFDRVPRQEWIMVHDAARPCIRHSDISTLIEHGMRNKDGAILAAPIRDTVKRGQAYSAIETSMDRDRLWRALTPQLFRFDDLHSALGAALADDSARSRITDEASAIEYQGGKPLLIPAADDNIKVTTLHDLALAELVLTTPL